jgi:putative transposase
MPRPPRAIVANYCYHVLNRANRRAEVFHEPADYDAFISLMAKAQDHEELPLLAACLMPNHFHLVVQPGRAESISRWVHWLCTTHVRHYHAKYGSSGRIWQGPYKACLIQTDQYLLTAMRYVERNALEARLVRHAEDWTWGSLRWRRAVKSPLTLSRAPIDLPSYWTEFVNQPQTAVELAALRECVNGQKPFGEPAWASEMEQLRPRSGTKR